MNNIEKERIRIRKIAQFWVLFIGIGAVAGSAMMFIPPVGKWMGMEGLLPPMHKLPLPEALFHNLIFPGIMLLCVNGITNIAAYILILKKHRFAPISVLFCGIILMLWISVQFYIFPLNFMSVLYFLFGILQAWTGWRYLKRSHECNFPKI